MICITFLWKKLSLPTLHFHFLTCLLLMKASLCSVSAHSHPLNSPHTSLSAPLIPHSIFFWDFSSTWIFQQTFLSVIVRHISWTIPFSLVYCLPYHSSPIFLEKSLPFPPLPVHCTCNKKRAEARETVTLISFYTIFHFMSKTLTAPAIQQNNLILLMYYLKLEAIYHKIMQDGNV